MSERRVRADEFDVILRRAAQSERSPLVPARPDLTVTELMEVSSPDRLVLVRPNSPSPATVEITPPGPTRRIRVLSMK